MTLTKKSITVKGIGLMYNKAEIIKAIRVMEHERNKLSLEREMLSAKMKVLSGTIMQLELCLAIGAENEIRTAYDYLA